MDSSLLENFAEVFVRGEQKKHRVPITDCAKPAVTSKLKTRWQQALDVLRAYTGVQAALVMQITRSELRVFVRSTVDKSLYQEGEGCALGSGLYCETVLGTNQPLFVQDAVRDAAWQDNPDLKFGMTHYYGLPLHWPGGVLFGTLCVLDRQPKMTSEMICTVFKEFASSMEKDLAILCLTEEQGKKLDLYTKVINTLHQEMVDYIGIIYPETGLFEFLAKSPEIHFPELGQLVSYEQCCSYVGKNFVQEAERDYFAKVTSLDFISKNLGEKQNFSTPYMRTEGEHSFCKQLNYKWLDKNKKTILVIRSDTTSSYQRDQQQLRIVQKARMEADRANESKSTFFAAMSHDMRTPLNGIIGFTDIALKETNPARKQDYLQKIKASGELLLDLINDILDISRIESGKMTLQLEETDSREIGEIVVNAMRPAAEVKNIKLLAEIEQFPHKTIWIDKLKVQKVILNLLSNAIKYTKPGGTVWINIQEIKPPVEGRNRRIIIRDTGIGMSQDFLPKLFEPFAQENRSESARTIGTGLGMSIVKRIVDLMDGKITVQSQLNRGTEFTVELPIARVSEGIRIHQQQEENLSTLAGKKILLCEDNAINSEIARHMLKNKGMLVKVAVNGKQGVESFAASAEYEYAAILMDIRMPVMDGYAATQAIRSMPRRDAKTVPIIAMTADAFEESIRKSEEVGMVGYVVKPVDQAKLFAKLSACLGKD